MNTTTIAVALAAAFTAMCALADAPGSGKADAPRVMSAAPRYTRTMEDLLDAAQRLREAVQVMATQPASARRDDAMTAARRALMQAQRTMLDLPPGTRTTGDRYVAPGDAAPQAGQPERPRGTAMEELHDASARLLDAVDAIRREPAGESHDAAIADAHAALADADRAMRTLAQRDSTGNPPVAGSPALVVSSGR